jgi:ribosome biogenesis protein BRX1
MVETDDHKDIQKLVEIGPRFVLNLQKILSGSFTGSTIYSNPQYVSPNEVQAPRI